MYNILSKVIWLENVQCKNVLRLCKAAEPGTISSNFIRLSTLQRFVVIEIHISIRELSGSYLGRNTWI
jgi:hypothetical protein